MRLCSNVKPEIHHLTINKALVVLIWGRTGGNRGKKLVLLEVKELRLEGIAWISNMQSALLVVGLKCPGIRWLSNSVITSRLKIVGYAAPTQKTDEFSDIHL